MVGDEVGGGQQNLMLCLINGGYVHVTDREGGPHGFVLVDGDQRVELVVIALSQPLALRAEAVPETNKRLRERASRRTPQSQVGITPLGGIQRPQIVASDEANTAIDDQQLAVIQCVATWIQQIPEMAHGAIYQHMNSWMK